MNVETVKEEDVEDMFPSLIPITCILIDLLHAVIPSRESETVTLLRLCKDFKKLVLSTYFSYIQLEVLARIFKRSLNDEYVWKRQKINNKYKSIVSTS